jgi:hypothetical protein
LGREQAPGQEIGIIPILRVFLKGFSGPVQRPGIIILEGVPGLLEIIVGRIIEGGLFGPDLPEKQA